MEEIQEIIEEIPMIRLSDYSLSGISAGTLTAILAALFLITCIGIGYQRGVIVELSGLISIAASLIVLLLVKPYAASFFPSSFGRVPRAVVYLLVCFIVFRVVRMFVRKIGTIFRNVPVIGFVVGVLGAVCGCISGVLVLLIIQHAAGIDITGAVSETLDKLPFSV